jgi:sugar O-acyltransferase (sialic acid O-acetyltransferase NeuD family)
MAERSIAILGASGHGKVIAALVRALGRDVQAFYDDDRAKWGSTFFGAPVRGPLEAARDHDADLVIAIGINKTRARVVERLGAGTRYATLVHPRAWVDTSVVVGEGSVVFASATVQPDTRIGRHVIVNTSSSIDHDGIIADYVHLAPGVHLAGDVHVADGAFLGTGTVAIPGKKIGAWATVGAGSVVIRDVAEHATVLGVPARAR